MATLLLPTPPSEALAHSADFLSKLREALDDAVAWADTIWPTPISDPGFRAYAIRAMASQELQRRPFSGSWSMGRRLTNSGIEVLCGPFAVRVLKAHHDSAPHPGPNRARQTFYTQSDERLRSEDLQLPLNLTDSASGLPLTNLIVDWDVDEQRVITLALSKPIATWRYGERPRLEWRRFVEDAGGLPRFDPAEEDVDVEPRFDAGDLSAQEEA